MRAVLHQVCGRLGGRSHYGNSAVRWRTSVTGATWSADLFGVTRWQTGLMAESGGQRRILVTGGSHGIGAAICQAFAQLGDTVAVHCGTSRDAANALVASLPGSGHIVTQADLRDADAVRLMVDDAAASCFSMRTRFSIAERRLWRPSHSKRGLRPVPLLQVHLFEGRPPAVKAQFVREFTEVVERVLGSSSERISVLVSEYAEGDWNVAGEPLRLPEGALDD
jgi:4-oxalocrotonate tautomerase family enzyme